MPLVCPLTVTEAPISVSPDSESLTYPLSVYLFCDQDTNENSNSDKVNSLLITIYCCNRESHSLHRSSLFLCMDYQYLFYRSANSLPCCRAPGNKTGSILFVRHT